MIIRKLFEFENAHIVRFCSSSRCKSSIHGHSYKVEVLLESKYLDNAGMVYDFGLLKTHMRQIIDSFDHAITLFNQDDESYLNEMKKYSQRWISLPVNVSAENLVIVEDADPIPSPYYNHAEILMCNDPLGENPNVEGSFWLNRNSLYHVNITLTYDNGTRATRTQGDGEYVINLKELIN